MAQRKTRARREERRRRKGGSAADTKELIGNFEAGKRRIEGKGARGEEGGIWNA